ncbi:hypothetical protein TWF225_002644 [Orbilia oligospora]|uniref:non-specific serine/threonine protein kinase n=1 Tax=Orbilia oligospora TaxID=2813651 RepID=A0A7C8PB45_ORBOL|nr:hypothetical protein TWF751_011847 [Orbilia oligospora]KAF3162406.1 hypothetical protein TWF225_002644 [Orbilia oligospora]KAF3237024.1 hypothetical protein TWF128_001239 [Orbilia oligospora]KAF3251604.1 hypothetical protein TWF217_007943 [Orbilia oligospora]KAF3277608.1 hypothetical protein TWF132_001421 [Orbilia oligospora]
MVDAVDMAESRSSKSQAALNEGKRRRGSSSLSDYTLGDCLGRGASGSVYRAINYTTGETVAIKQIRLSDLPHSELGAIMREIDLLKNLNHPHIVQYHGFVKSVDSLYIILEFCENGSLHSICKNFGKFPEHLVGRYTGQVLDGLFYLHEQGVIHRDIKGANILTTKEGHIKLADFGVATRANDATVVGTPYWMAPEVIELVGATTASDIWSVGCTVIELLTGDPPYYDLSPMQALFRIVSDDHPSLPEGASPAVRDFLMQCFQKDPNLRVSARKLLRHPWIVKTRPVSKEPNPKYVDDVRSVQQWNEALKMPLDVHGVRSKPVPSHQVPQSKIDPTNKDGFAALQESSFDDNWDDDFTPSINSSSFDLTHLKSHDATGGQSIRRNQASSEQATYPGYFAQEDDNMDTIKPKKISLLKALHIEQGKQKSRSSTSASATLSESYPPGGKSLFPSLFADHLASESIEDVEDFDMNDLESPFGQEQEQDLSSIVSRKPIDRFRRSHSNEVEHSRISGDTRLLKLGSRDDSSLDELKVAAKIHKYTEAEEEDDFSDIFWVPDSLGPKHDGASRKNNLVLATKGTDPKIGLSDEYEEDDPFSELEEGLTELDLDANIARDQHARLCTEVSSYIESLKSQHTGIFLEDTTAKLLGILLDSPETKTAVIASHGLLPILEVLESGRNREVNITLLRVINALTFNDIELLENLCFVGGIPTITKFATKHHHKEIRLEAAIFIRQICHMSRLTLQMFVSCGGLNVLVELIEDDYSTHKELVLTGIEGVVDVFKLQGSTPKNDFCRILSRHMVLRPLSLVLSQICKEKEDRYEVYCEKIVNLFYLFSQAENQVKEVIADRVTLKRIMKDLPDLPLTCQIAFLKFVKNLSMLSTTLDILQNANAIEVLIEMLSENTHKPQFKELSNQILSIMFNLCRHSKSRQEEAAINGIIPVLQKIVRTDRPLKEFALPILCDMAHSGRLGRKYLWQNNGLEFFVSLLSEPYWQVASLEAILVWLHEEPAQIEERLLQSNATRALVSCFTGSKTNTFENILEPFQKLCRLSGPIARAMGHPDFFERVLQKLTHPKAVVRLSLLRIVRSICDANGDQEDLLARSGLFPMILWLAENDGAILVRNIASEFVKTRKNQLQSGRNHKYHASSTPATPRSMGIFRASSHLSRPRKHADYSPISHDIEGSKETGLKANKTCLKIERRKRQQST